MKRAPKTNAEDEQLEVPVLSCGLHLVVGEPSRRIVHSLATRPEAVADNDGALNQVSCFHAFIFGGQRGGSI